MLQQAVKRFFILNLLGLFILTCLSQLPLIALDTPNTTSIFFTNDIYTAPGIPFEVEVKLDTDKNVSGYQLQLLYDENLFELSNFDYDMAKYPGLSYEIETAGIIHVQFNAPQSTITGSNPIFKLSFVIPSEIPVGKYVLLSIDQTFNNQITHLDSNNQVNIIPAVSYLFKTIDVVMFGDINGDNQIGIHDALAIQSHLTGESIISDSMLKIADINMDGAINLMDVALIQLYVDGKIGVLGPSVTGDIPLSFFKEANGLYDFTRLGYVDIAKIYAAAENYLLENVYGGVPLFTPASRVIFSPRIQLFSAEYNGVMGFGLPFSKLTVDDSQVLMSGSTYGNPEEYTFRSVYSNDPTVFNPWTADDSSSDEFIQQVSGSLYDFFFDDTKTGFNLQASLAKSDPIPVNPQLVDGEVVATLWQIPIKDNLTWTYHPDTDLTGLPSGHDVLNVDDFLWSYRYALEQQWFRARSGGGDFVSYQVKGAAEYLAGSIGINDVGLRLASGKSNTLEIEYNIDKSMFDVKYQFSSASLSPLNEQLLQKLTPSVYATSPETTPSSGVYYLDTWTQGEKLLFKKNTNHPLTNLYHYTGLQYTFMAGSELIFQAFLDGKLDMANVPSGQALSYASDQRVKSIASSTTYRLVINGFGTESRRDDYIASHPEVPINPDFIPEPILMYPSMRQALYYGFDRYDAAVNQAKIYLPAFTLFSNNYFVDVAHGVSIRTLPAGAAILDKYGQGSYGFVPSLAVTLFKQAVDEAISAGYYTPGTASSYTVISLDLTYSSSGNTYLQTMVQQLKSQYESRLLDEKNYVRLQINLIDVAFPSSYYDFMQKANTDLGIGGISGSIPSPEQGLLSYFNDDNRSGFTLDFGIDTTAANIPISYRNAAGVMVYELWSYNAIVSALSGPVYVKDGMEQVYWDTPEALIYHDLVLKNDLKTSVDSNDLGITELLLGDLDEIAQASNVMAIEGYLVQTYSGKDYLYVLKKTSSGYGLYEIIPLARSVKQAIEIDAKGVTLNTVSDEPLTLEAFNAIPYISNYYGSFNTMAEIWTEFEVPEGLEAYIYRTQFDDLQTDAYIVIKVGDFYIGWQWL